MTPIVTSTRVVTRVAAARIWKRDRAPAGTAAFYRRSGYPSPMRSPVVAIAAVVAALVVAACSPGGTPTPSGSASASSGASPGSSPSGSGATQYSVLPSLVSSEQVVGPNRFLFGFVDAKTNSPVGGPDRTASVSAYPQAKGPASAVNADGTFMWTIPDSRGIYRAAIDFSEAGPWIATFTTAAAGAAAETIGPFTFDVKAEGVTIQVGEKAPSVATPTLADVGGDISKISSDDTPDPAFFEVSEAAALAAGKPFVLVFATPKFCTSQACGPLLDLVKSESATYPTVTFINVEPYTLEWTNGQLQPVLDANGYPQPVEASTAFDILSEPWVFVVDKTGTVTASFEATSDKAELSQAIAAVAG